LGKGVEACDELDFDLTNADLVGLANERSLSIISSLISEDCANHGENSRLVKGEKGTDAQRRRTPQ
jgi:hypothetical protein